MMGNSLRDDIKCLLDNWLRGRENRTLQVLADQIDIRYNTLRRIHIGQVDPSLETCLRILNFISTPEEASAFASVHFPEVGKFYNRMARKDSHHATTFASEIKEDWKDFNSFIILSLSMMKLATTENIRRFLGDTGLITADALCKKGFVIWKEEELLMRDGSDFCVSQDPSTNLAALSHLVSIFKARMENPFVNLVNVSVKDAENLRRMSQEFVREAAAIIDNSEGGEIVALALLFGNLTKGLV